METEQVFPAREIESDMPDGLKFAVFEAAQAAILDNKIDKDVATTLKKKFDTHDTFGGTWHCIVGKNFGCSITHETQYSMFFEINGQHFLMFKSKD